MSLNFYGLENEDPYNYLNDFHAVCQTFKYEKFSDDDVKLRLFPFSLKDRQCQIFVEIKNFFLDDPYLCKYCADQIVRRCVSENEFQNILSFCHEQACEDHFNAKKTATKVLQCGFYWPTIFRDAYTFCSSCDRCQRNNEWGALHEGT